MFRFVRLSTFLGWMFASAVCGAGLMLSAFYLYLTPNLPNADRLKTTQLQTPLRIYSADNKSIAEFGEKRRTPIEFDQIPEQLIQAFIAAEDNRFFEHGGIDIKGLVRATAQLVASGQIKSGGSTITMQVAKNFFLSRERTFIRKFNEIFLAIQIEQSLSKQEILELYLNKIYLGNRAYGVEAAAQVYYGRPIQELTLAEMAMIAGLPKAPSSYNPIANPERAIIRRNWILDRMLDLGMVTKQQHEIATQAQVTAQFHGGSSELYAPYVAEMARIELIKMFGSEAYTAGLKAYLTIDSENQQAARRALRKGLEEYDQRHGYRGVLGTLSPEDLNQPKKTKQILSSLKTGSGNVAAVVLDSGEDFANALTASGESISLSKESIEWAGAYVNVNRKAPAPTSVSDLLSPGDIIEVRQIPSSEGKTWQLSQVPEVQGALVSLSPDDGAIQALVGGYDFSLSHYNRATQAKRQPGSNFKAFVYLAALEHGATAATLINDAPIVFEDKNLEATWRPENSSGRFYGPTRLRKALYNSRNLVSIRLLKETGVRETIQSLLRFGFDKDELPRDLSLALGSAAITPIKVATGYAMIANGGHYIEPYLIERVENANGEIIYQSEPYRVCDKHCVSHLNNLSNDTEPSLDGTSGFKPAPRIADERSVYIIHSMLKDVIRLGTGRRAKVLDRSDLAGKTGTTNDQKDAWFSGFNTKIATTAWVGFDAPRTLGRREYGARAALPIWIDYMRTALKDIPSSHMKRPDGLVTVKIDPSSGLLATPGSQGAIFELFRHENAPTQLSQPAHPSTQETGVKNERTLAPEDIF